MSNQLSPDNILHTGMAFWVSKTLLSAVEIGVFTELAHGATSYETLMRRLGLHPRSARDFLDSLVALRFLTRAGHLLRKPIYSSIAPSPLIDVRESRCPRSQAETALNGRRPRL